MKKISFLGIGLMGLPMAKNLIKNNYQLNVFNRTINKTEPLKNKATIANSIAECIKDSEVVITMLSDDQAIEAVMKNPEFINNLKTNTTVIDMSSIKPKTAKFFSEYFKKRNINYLDAPVSGGTIGAEEATLAIMVGGEENIFNQNLDILKCMGNPVLVGPSPSGQIAKLANQIIVGVTIGAVSEAITLAETTGANATKLLKALTGGWADSKILQTHGKRMIDKDFTARAKNSTHLKDMNNIVEWGREFNLELPISKLIQSMYQNLCNRKLNDKDHSSLYLELENLNKK